MSKKKYVAVMTICAVLLLLINIGVKGWDLREFQLDSFLLKMLL